MLRTLTEFPCRMEREGALQQGCKMLLQRIAASSYAIETSAMMNSLPAEASDALMANYGQGDNHQSFPFYFCGQPPFPRLQFQQKQDHPRFPVRPSYTAKLYGPSCAAGGDSPCIERSAREYAPFAGLEDAFERTCRCKLPGLQQEARGCPLRSCL